MKHPAITIIIPAKNEAHRIGPTLQSYATYLNTHYAHRYTLLVVLNNCTDTTSQVVRTLKRRFPAITLIETPDPIGKGGAVIEGFRRARTPLVGYLDADGSTPPFAYLHLINNIGSSSGIIASRWMPSSHVYPHQSFKRRIASRAFNLFTKILFFLPFKDTQCGAKVFKTSAVSSIINKLYITQWAFDVNLLYVLIKEKFSIKETPTTWYDKEGSRLQFPKTPVKMFFSLLRLRLLYSPFAFVVTLYDKLPEPLKIHNW